LGGVPEAMTRDCTPDRWQRNTDEAVQSWVGFQRSAESPMLRSESVRIVYLMVRLQWSNVVQQFKITFRHQFVECIEPKVGADLVHNKIDGRSCLRSVLVDG
jgi:hypothetical protein